MDYLIDIATLTGACSISLGDVAAGVCSNSDIMANFLTSSMRSRGESFWRLPLYEEFKDYMKSDVADMINANENRLAGTSTAAIFLQEFVDETPWVHLDIASVMSVKSTRGSDVKGMSGFGVRSLLELIVFISGNKP